MSERLWTFAEVLDAIPVGKTVLREIVAGLGFERAPGRRKYVFTAQQVEAIKGAVLCRSNSSPQEKAAPPITGYAGQSLASTLTKAQERIAERLRKPISPDAAARSKVVSLAGARTRRSPPP